MVRLLAVPYFMHEYGALELEKEYLSHLKSVYATTGQEEQLKLTWAEMSGNLDLYSIFFNCVFILQN